MVPRRQCIEPGPHVKARHGGGHAAGPIEIQRDYRLYGNHDISDPRRFRGAPQREPRRRERGLRGQGRQGHGDRDRERPRGDRRGPEVRRPSAAARVRRAGPESRNFKVGDEVEVYVDRVENSQGEAMLSRDRARREAAWDKLEKEFSAGNRVEGVIFGRVKGGFTVDLGGAVAFLPGSQVDIRPVRDVGPLMEIPQPFQVLKMDRRRGNIVVSRRAILEETRAEQRSGLIQSPGRGPGHRRRGQEHHRLRCVRRPRRDRRPAARHRHQLQARQPPERGAGHRRHGEGADHPHQP